jgi:GNAT superfamily N-acetyltransferase
VQDLHVANRPDQFRPASVEEVAAWVHPLLSRARIHVWIAQFGDVAAGYVSAAFHERPATPFTAARRWCEMDQIGVDPAWRRRGVAGALIQTVVARARAEGVHQIETVCWSFNGEATVLLERTGFVPKFVRFEMPV